MRETRNDRMSYSKQITYNTFGTVVTLFCQWLIIMFIPKITDFAEAGIFAVDLCMLHIEPYCHLFSERISNIGSKHKIY